MACATWRFGMYLTRFDRHVTCASSKTSVYSWDLATEVPPNDIIRRQVRIHQSNTQPMTIRIAQSAVWQLPAGAATARYHDRSAGGRNAAHARPYHPEKGLEERRGHNQS